MKRLFIALHTYGGFLFFPLLLILGFSSLNFNHHFGVMQPEENWTETQTTFDVANLAGKKMLAENLRDSLGLMGFCPSWTQELNEETFKFSVVHNGAEYMIDISLKTGETIVRRRSNGIGNVINSLHMFNGNIPEGTMIINSWQYFKNICNYYLIVIIFTSLYFFLKRKPRLLLFFVLTLAVSTTLMIYIWLVG